MGKKSEKKALFKAQTFFYYKFLVFQQKISNFAKKMKQNGNIRFF